MRTIPEPVWLAAARSELGIREAAGAASNATVLAYYRDVGHDWVLDDAVAWCAAFAGAMLERNGIRSTRSLRARSYLTWGAPLHEPSTGCIAVFSRGDDPQSGHVGFVLGETASHLEILGGNQADRVSIEMFPKRRLLGLRWPSTPPTMQSETPFSLALAHVRLLEGGWSEHPSDPGGPTKAGITLAVLAADRGIALTAASRGRLIAALRSLSNEAIVDIYHRRYWLRARCDALAPPLALLHFDTAVNQGPVTAIRLLQEAAGAVVDGELGEMTLRAIAKHRLGVLIDRYAELRLARYRRTRNFAVFGRGWTTRVAHSRRAAHALDAHLASPQPRQETRPMTQQPKWWGRSLTIWGAAITALSTVLPLLGPLLGIDITADAVRQFGAQITQILQLLGGVIGTALTVYGRFRAEAPLERRSFKLSL